MRDIPLFTTENGVAFLTLKEIPYCGDAYIRILDSIEPDLLIKECADFCHMAGAKNVYLTGNNISEKYPLFTEIWHMECAKGLLPECGATLVPVKDTNINHWRDVYNARMTNVPGAVFMSKVRVEELLKSGKAYFVYQGTQMLGIGAVSRERIDCIASVVPGAGARVLYTLATAISGEMLQLEVASENKRAVSFYERLGFEKTAVNEAWYKYIP